MLIIVIVIGAVIKKKSVTWLNQNIKVFTIS